ncbi:MAG: hypothetical protein KBD24_04020 [Candidatus Pacebacteria bacterium]|nr:hypothetical protein [Candidatus Paceibacterota bacterium]
MPEETQTTNMAERVLGAIQERGVAPKPTWHFLLHEWVVWVVAFSALVVGSIATALTLYIGNASFFMEQHIVRSSGAVFFEMLPFVWLVLLVVGIGYSVHAVHTTKHGYRWPTTALVGVALLASIGLGAVVYATGASEAIDRYLLAQMPMYRPMSGFNPQHWTAPSVGIVAGVVTSVEVEGFHIEGLEGEEIVVRLTASSSVPQSMIVREGMMVRVMGTTTANEEGEVFEAESVRPFRGRGGMRGRGLHAPQGTGVQHGTEGSPAGVAPGRDAL